MRRSSLAAVLVTTAAGLVASVALRRLAARRRATAGRPAVPAAVAPPVALPAAELPAGPDAVVLPFERRAAAEPAVERPAAPTRCGDSGGRTRTGAPCAARATSGGRCHHHPLAA